MNKLVGCWRRLLAPGETARGKPFGGGMSEGGDLAAALIRPSGYRRPPGTGRPSPHVTAPLSLIMQLMLIGIWEAARR